jgi:hypothetical protein
VQVLKADEAFTFLRLQSNVWRKDAPGFQRKHGAFYVFKFSIPLPKEVSVNLTGEGELQTYRLPPSFGERLARVTIQYDLRIELRQGMFGRHAQYVYRATFPCRYPHNPTAFIHPSVSSPLFSPCLLLSFIRLHTRKTYRYPRPMLIEAVGSVFNLSTLKELFS